MAYVPLAMRLYRFWIYVDMESDFLGFYLASGEKIRGNLTRERIEYMKRTAPEKYHEALTPKTEIGCKRKVNDTDYLTCLHNDNVDLVWADPIDEITESGVRTKSGREVSADAIILANGFETQQVLYPLDIKGEKGVSLTAHVCETLPLWPLANTGGAKKNSGRLNPMDTPKPTTALASPDSPISS
jgi:hypothetical protein